MKDPVYNTMMGSAYISDRMDEFTGSYVLTLAGYNAGPGRAREWIKEFGDPRDGSVDPDRLDPPHSLRGDARLRAEGAVQHPDLSRAPRRGSQRRASSRPT
jgi:soluble lytic murein transglycosylase-like protein